MASELKVGGKVESDVETVLGLGVLRCSRADSGARQRQPYLVGGEKAARDLRVGGGMKAVAAAIQESRADLVEGSARFDAGAFIS